MKQPKILVIVVNWNNIEETLKCVKAVLKQKNVNFELALVDNGSADGVKKILKQRLPKSTKIKWIENSLNLGFTKAVNLVIKERVFSKSTFSHVALLNNNAFPEPQWLEELLKTSDFTEASFVASKLIQYHHPERLESAGLQLLNTGDLIPKGYNGDLIDHSQITYPIGPSGGAALYEVSALKAVGLFDEDFPMGYEDGEFALRLFVREKKVAFAPNAIVHHMGSLSIDKNKDSKKLFESVYNLRQAYYIHAPLAAMVNDFLWSKVRNLCFFLTGNWRLWWFYLKANFSIFTHSKYLKAKRKKAQKQRTISAWKFLRAQKNCIISDFHRMRKRKELGQKHFYRQD